MGKNKSSSLKWLSAHIFIIFMVFLIGTGDIKFSGANALIHFVIDATLWNLYKVAVWYRYTGHLYPKSKKDKLRGLVEKISQKHKYWEDHLFYTTIGLDQLLHGLTIILLVHFMEVV